MAGATLPGPQARIEQTERRFEAGSDRWVVTWRLTNLAALPLQMLAARLPHGRFRSEARELIPALLSPNASTLLSLPVACREAPGAVVENAFLILRVLHGEEHWRLLARLRVTFDTDGGPQSRTEVVTVHPVGFSEGRREDAHE